MRLEGQVDGIDFLVPIKERALVLAKVMDGKVMDRNRTEALP